MELLTQPLNLVEVPLKHWEIRTHATLVQMVANKHITVDELRRHIESQPDYENLSYYEKWTLAMCSSCIERGIFSGSDISSRYLPSSTSSSQNIKDGDFVRVKDITSRVPFRRPHLRTPGYVRGI
jgi:hypothetical protein